MTQFLNLFLKDLKFLWRGSVGWSLLIAISIVFGAVMSLIATNIPVSEIYPMMYASIGFVLMLIVPVVVIYPAQADREAGVEDVVLCSPVSSFIMVTSRWAAGMVSAAAAVLSTFPGFVVLGVFAAPDFGKIFSVYSGWLITSAVFVSVGVWAITTARSAVVAVFLSWVTQLTLWLLGPVAALLAGFSSLVIKSISLVEHSYGFEQGVLIFSDIVYFVILTIIFIVGSSVALDRRRL